MTAMFNQQWETKFLCPHNKKATKFFAPHVTRAIIIDVADTYRLAWKSFDIERLRYLNVDITQLQTVLKSKRNFEHLRELRLWARQTLDAPRVEIDFGHKFPNLKHINFDEAVRIKCKDEQMPRDLSSAIIDLSNFNGPASRLDTLLRRNSKLTTFNMTSAMDTNRVITCLRDHGLHQTLTKLRLHMINPINFDGLHGNYDLSSDLAEFTKIRDLQIHFELSINDTMTVYTQHNVQMLQKLGNLEEFIYGTHSCTPNHASMRSFLQSFGTNAPPKLKRFIFAAYRGIPHDIWHEFLEIKPNHVECFDDMMRYCEYKSMKLKKASR